MTDRGIIFSAPMVLALLAGRKTQTRRLATLQRKRQGARPDDPAAFYPSPNSMRNWQAGDRAYVRENGAWKLADEVAPEPGRKRGFVWYAADGDPSGLAFFGGKQSPSIHMPRWASRLTLIVEAVKVERLQAISEVDALVEGIEETYGIIGVDCHGGRHSERSGWRYFWAGSGDEGSETAAAAYAELWNSLHAAPGTAWDDNPDVVAITFRVERENIDRLAA